MLTAGTPAGGGRRTPADGGRADTPAGGGRRTPRRAADRRTPRRALRYRGAYIHAYATGEGGHGGGPTGEAGKTHQQEVPTDI